MASNYSDYEQTASYSTNNTFSNYNQAKFSSLSGNDADEPEQFRKIFVGNLNYSTTEDTLREYFCMFGQLLDCVIMKDPKTNKY